MGRSAQKTLLAAVTATGFLTALAMSGVNVALEEIASDLRLSAVTISWVTLSTILGTGALLMPMARVADFRGRMLVYNLGLAGFGVFLFASAFARNAAVLILTPYRTGTVAILAQRLSGL